MLAIATQFNNKPLLKEEVFLDMIRNISVLLLFNQVLTTNVSQTDGIRYRPKECLGRGMDKTRVEKLKVVDWSRVGGVGG